MVGALTLVLVSLLAAGASGADSPPQDGTAETGTTPSRTERLRALGYLDYSTEADAAAGRAGVTLFDPARAQAGHNLVVSSLECTARLVAMDGEVLHVWRQQSECASWFSAEGLSGGDLVVTGRVRPSSPDRTTPPGRFTARIAPDGRVRWLRQMRSHHQIDFTPEREVLVMTEARVAPERFEKTGRALESGIAIHENPLHWLDENGDPVDSLSLLDALLAGTTDFALTETSAMLETATYLGVFHANSAHAMDQPHLAGADPLHAADNVLVTSRNQDRVFIVSRKTRSLLWQWGKDELSRPHDGTWLGNGNILIFDNGVERRSSRVVEVDPARGKVVWQYPGADGEAFYSAVRGMAQRLENGNTLIVVSQAGMAFEITPSGEVVWRYRSPLRRARGRRPALMSIRRYPEGFLVPPAHLERGPDR